MCTNCSCACNVMFHAKIPPADESSCVSPACDWTARPTQDFQSPKYRSCQEWFGLCCAAQCKPPSAIPAAVSTRPDIVVLSAVLNFPPLAYHSGWCAAAIASPASPLYTRSLSPSVGTFHFQPHHWWRTSSIHFSRVPQTRKTMDLIIDTLCYLQPESYSLVHRHSSSFFCFH